MKDKKYYWIKLRTDFFSRNEIDFLLSQENGCKYIVLYQMLCLSTANNNGEMGSRIGEVFIPYDVKKIVRDTKYFDFDTVTVALEIFKKLGLIYEQENNIFKITNFEEMVGSEVSSAKRVREYRARQKMLQCNTNVTQDIDIDNKRKDNRDKEKEKDTNTICHLHFKEKVESCCNCLKKNICNLPTSISFKAKYNCNVEEYKEKEEVPIYYKDDNGNEYWHGKLIESAPATEEEIREIEEMLKEFR